MKKLIRRMGAGVAATALAVSMFAVVGVSGASADTSGTVRDAGGSTPASGSGSLANPTPTKKACLYDSLIYSDGSVIVVNNKEYRCVGNAWQPN